MSLAGYLSPLRSTRIPAAEHAELCHDHAMPRLTEFLEKKEPGDGISLILRTQVSPSNGG